MNETNNILNELRNQAHDCIKELMGGLTMDLSVSATKYGAIIREREVKDAKLLLQVLFVYAISGLSQRMLAVHAFFIGAGDISDQAWQKKIVRCVPWLSYLLSDVLLNLTTVDRTHYKGEFVHLLDGSIFTQAGHGGQKLRLHMDYNLSVGAVEELKITDIHTAESVHAFNMKSGHIYLADAGFGRGKNLAHVLSCKAHALFRMTPNNVSLAKDASGKVKINMVEKLDIKGDVLDFTCYAHSVNGKYVPVRIVAGRLPEDKALLAKERKKRRTSKSQQKLKKETLVYAEWVILMTTLDYNYSTDFLLRMYRARWQIELLFKRIKQFFRVTKLRKATIEHSKALVLIWLIIWAMSERQAIAAEIYLLNKQADMERYSPWTMLNFFIRRYEAIMNSIFAFSFNFQHHFLYIFRRLRNHRAGRPNHYSYFRFCCFSSLANHDCTFALAAA